MLEVIKNVVKVEELRSRILFTLGMLVVFRIGVHIPIPGIDSGELKEFFANSNAASVIGHLDLFTGGALSRMSVFSLGIMPYISASIIIQLLTAVFPYLERLSKEGDAGRKKITQYTRYGTVGLSIIQGSGIGIGIVAMGPQILVGSLPSWAFKVIAVITLTAGTAFLMWVGEQVNERGIGNGISLLIFAGIVADIPAAVFDSINLLVAGSLTILVLLAVAAIMVGVMGAVILIETAYRKLAIQYAKRMQGQKMLGGQSSHLPLKINAAGVIPPIFASSLLMFPSTITGFVNVEWIQVLGQYFLPDRFAYNVLFVILICFFCFFYTAIQFNPVKIAEDLKRYGGFIPGIRPGNKTAEYINLVLSRLTFGGAFYLSLICVLPVILYSWLDVPFSFGGTALLIVVGVALDTTNQMETFLLHRNYDGFMRKKSKRKKY